MSFWTPENLRVVLAGQWIRRPDVARTAALSGLSTDSRAIRSDQVFLALRGEKTDGHAYLASAAASGSPLLIVDDEAAVAAASGTIGADVGVLKVADTGQALLKLAQAYRRTLDSTRVIAVGGSNGKTTTVRLIQSVLSGTLRGTASQKSFNNAVGVPLTILSARKGDQFLICEVGTNAPGEIAPLASVVEPDIAVITSIGREHLDTHAPACRDKERDLVLGVHHRGDEGRHVLRRIVRLQICSLVADQGVACCMGFIEGVVACLLGVVP